MGGACQQSAIIPTVDNAQCLIQQARSALHTVKKPEVFVLVSDALLATHTVLGNTKGKVSHEFINSNKFTQAFIAQMKQAQEGVK
jgi:hypothetical protein